MGPRVVALACLLAPAVAGCGTADRENDAAAVAERFHAALEAGNGHAACAELNLTSAFSTLAEGGVDFLDEAPDGWNVSAAGYQPTAPEQPHECELEG